MRGLFRKTLHEVWLAVLLYAGALCGIMALLTYILPQIQEGFGGIAQQMPFVRSLVSALLGTELGDQISAQTMQAFLWVHPVVLSLIWAHEIGFCSRVPAGEIDRGTIDILLGLPVSRRKVYCCDSLVWLVSGLLIMLMGLLGHRLAAPTMPEAMRPAMSRSLLVMANLFCVYAAVGGIAWLVSALSDRRGRAVGGAFALVVGSFLLNFLAQFWEPAQRIAFLSVMNYYQPAQVMQSGEVPWNNIAVLLCVGVVTWLLGGEILARRSICTV